MANYDKDMVAEFRKLNRTLAEINRSLRRIAPLDVVDAFDPDDEEVTEDDLPFS